MEIILLLLEIIFALMEIILALMKIIFAQLEIIFVKGRPQRRRSRMQLRPLYQTTAWDSK